MSGRRLPSAGPPSGSSSSSPPSSSSGKAPPASSPQPGTQPLVQNRPDGVGQSAVRAQSPLPTKLGAKEKRALTFRNTFVIQAGTRQVRSDHDAGPSCPPLQKPRNTDASSCRELSVCDGPEWLVDFRASSRKVCLPTAQGCACLAEAACCPKLRRWTTGCR